MYNRPQIYELFINILINNQKKHSVTNKHRKIDAKELSKKLSSVILCVFSLYNSV